jgi:hypothetical protein
VGGLCIHDAVQLVVQIAESDIGLIVLMYQVITEGLYGLEIFFPISDSVLNGGK